MLAWRRLHYHEVYKAQMSYYHYRNLCENWESPCTIMYHHVPNKCFWIAFPPKKNWHGSWKSLFERKIKSSSKPIFGFHVSFTGGVDINFGIVKFNFVAWNSTPSNGRQSTSLEKKEKLRLFMTGWYLKDGWMWSTWGWEGTLKVCSNGFGQVWLWHDFIEILNKMMAKRRVTFNFQLRSKIGEVLLAVLRFSKWIARNKQTNKRGE